MISDGYDSFVPSLGGNAQMEISNSNPFRAVRKKFSQSRKVPFKNAVFEGCGDFWLSSFTGILLNYAPERDGLKGTDSNTNSSLKH